MDDAAVMRFKHNGRNGPNGPPTACCSGGGFFTYHLPTWVERGAYVGNREGPKILSRRSTTCASFRVRVTIEACHPTHLGPRESIDHALNPANTSR